MLFKSSKLFFILIKLLKLLLNPIFYNLQPISIFKKFINLFDLALLDKIIYNIFEFDILEVIKDSSVLIKNQLFSAHLLDILYLNHIFQIT